MADAYRESISAVAGADLSNCLFHIVRATGYGPPPTVDISSHSAALSTVGAIGVLQNNPALGQAANVAIRGQGRVVAGASITAGAWFTSDASGRATTAGSGDICVGKIMETGVAGAYHHCIYYPPFRLIGGA